MTTKEMEEELEMPLEDLSYSQGYNALQLGEIDPMTFYESFLLVNEEETLLFKIKNKIKKLKEFIFKKPYKYKPYSYSKIELFKNCPYKFKLIYIDKLSTANTKNLLLTRGSFIHYCLEHNNSGKNFNLTQVFTQNEKEEALNVVNNFRKSNLGEQYLSQNGKHEIKFAMDKNFKSCSYYSHSKALLRGKIDYIFEKNDVLHIVDWKSGKYVEEPSYLQLTIYAIWGFAFYKNITKIVCSFVYVEHDKEHKKEFTRDKLNSYIELIQKDIDEIENTQDFNKNETSYCKYCDFLKIDNIST